MASDKSDGHSCPRIKMACRSDQQGVHASATGNTRNLVAAIQVVELLLGERKVAGLVSPENTYNNAFDLLLWGLSRSKALYLLR